MNLKGMMGWVERAIVPYGTSGIFWHAFAESSFFPIPPDITLIILSLARPELSLWYSLVCTLGSVTGAIAAYVVGKKGGRPLLQKIISREKIEIVQRYFHRYDVWAIAIAGFTPIPYKLFTISAGVFYIKFWRFIWASILSRGARFFMVGGLIYTFGEPIKTFIDRYFNLLSVIFMVLLIGGFYLVKHFSSRHLKKINSVS